MMFRFYNPHPKGKRVGDCVKRAIALAFGMDYMEVQRQLNRHKRALGLQHVNSTVNWKSFIKPHTIKELSFPAVAGQKRMNGRWFASAFSKGTFILRMANHITVCKDGVIYDTWDCREKCVYKAYKISN